MDGQFVVTMWLRKPLPTANNLSEALTLAQKVVLKELLTLKPGVENNDYQVQVMGVADDAPLAKLDY